MYKKHGHKQHSSLKVVFIFAIIIFIIDLIFSYPFLILIPIGIFYYFDLNLEKILKTFGITKYVKNNFGSDYEKIISKMRKNPIHQNRINKNRQRRKKVDQFFKSTNKKEKINYNNKLNKVVDGSDKPQKTKSTYSWKSAVSESKNKNHFGKKRKSIWDDYESVTKKFSSNKK